MNSRSTYLAELQAHSHLWSMAYRIKPEVLDNWIDGPERWKERYHWFNRMFNLSISRGLIRPIIWPIKSITGSWGCICVVLIRLSRTWYWKSDQRGSSIEISLFVYWIWRKAVLQTWQGFYSQRSVSIWAIERKQRELAQKKATYGNK